MSNKQLNRAASYRAKEPERFMDLQHLLFIKWDVCGINLNFSVHDEYECYVPGIMDLLDHPDVTVDEIETYMHECLEQGWGDCFTGQFDKECREVAEIAMAMYGPCFKDERKMSN